MKKLGGVVIPLITPLTNDDEVDVASLDRLTEYLITEGADCLYPCGTTGEMVYLTLEERKLVTETVVKAARGRVPVFAQVGAMNTRMTCELAHHAVACGADGIGVVTPWYHVLSDDALFGYYRSVVESVPMDYPVYLYAIPQNAVNDISVELASRLAGAYANILGIKYSYPDMCKIQKFMRIRDGSFDVLVGPDDLYAPVVMMGGAGVVSGNAMILTASYRALTEALRAGEVSLAARIQHETSLLNEILCRTNNIGAYKACLFRQGIIASKRLRPPLEGLRDEEEACLFADLLKHGVRFEKAAPVSHG